MSLVNNEKAKLTATYVNGLAIAVFAVGGVAPIFTNLYGGGAAAFPPWAVGGISVVCVAVSWGLHIAARRFLNGMKP